MRKIKEVLRLKHICALSKRQVAEICRISRSTVSEYLEQADKAGISWPLPKGLSESELEQRLFPPQPDPPSRASSAPSAKTRRISQAYFACAARIKRPELSQ
jgi:hypothetical protein